MAWANLDTPEGTEKVRAVRRTTCTPPLPPQPPVPLSSPQACLTAVSYLGLLVVLPQIYHMLQQVVESPSFLNKIAKLCPCGANCAHGEGCHAPAAPQVRHYPTAPCPRDNAAAPEIFLLTRLARLIDFSAFCPRFSQTPDGTAAHGEEVLHSDWWEVNRDAVEEAEDSLATDSSPQVSGLCESHLHTQLSPPPPPPPSLTRSGQPLNVSPL